MSIQARDVITMSLLMFISAGPIIELFVFHNCFMSRVASKPITTDDAFYLEIEDDTFGFFYSMKTLNPRS